MNHRHALVIGKFYPPHAGHHELIRYAAHQARRVTVVVMASAVETLPLADRVRWLRTDHSGADVVGVRCDAPLDVDDEQVWAAQVASIRAAARWVTPENVDLVVTGGDSYSRELAARFQAALALVDRVTNMVSGTAIRADLAAHWDQLSPTTRQGLATRVVFVGAESTGTTSVSGSVAEHYRIHWPDTQWVAEYGRDYTDIKWAAERRSRDVALGEITWERADFETVGAEQTRRENAAAATGSPVLICDTDALATTVWERRYLGPMARPDPDYARDLPRRDLYFITDHQQVAWTDDGIREGDLALRAAMTTSWFEDTLTARGQSWVLLTGPERARRRLAIRTIDQLLATRMTLRDPLHGPGFQGSH